MAGAALGPAAASTPRHEAPNILFIMADDLGWADLSCYGNTHYQTPGVDRLAREGMLFTDGYANSCLCSPTRTALMTGRYQYRLPVGMEEPVRPASGPDIGLPPGTPTLPSMLTSLGYRTALVGKWHLGAPPNYGPLHSGYDEFFGVSSGAVDYFTHTDGTGAHNLFFQDELVERQGYLTDLLTDHAEGYLRRRAGGASPFFLSLHYTAPHYPWQTTRDAATGGAIRPLFHNDGGSLEAYADMVAAMDRGIDRLLDVMDALDLTEKTLVVFTSDNGGERFSRMWPLSGGKGDLLEGGVRVPTLVRYPGRVPAGSSSAQVVMTMDWLPTLVALAGGAADAAAPPDGVDLSPTLLRGETIARRVFWRFKGKNQAAMRDGSLKYLRRRGHEFLFNLDEDPRERANIAQRRPDDFKRLKKAYAEWNATMLDDSHIVGREIPGRFLAQ